MTKKELNIIKKVYNEAWQDLLKYEIYLLEDGGQLETNSHRMELLYAYVALSDLVSNLGLSASDLANTETEILVEKVFSFRYGNKGDVQND